MPVETKIYKMLWDVEQRLAALSLDRKGLLRVVEIAHSAAAEANPFHPANARGTFSYMHGVHALRDRFVNTEWTVCRPDGLEMIQNASLTLRVGYSNVDKACVDGDLPRARSTKGAAAERACQGNLFPNLPHQAPQKESSWTTFFVMVDPWGAAELSCPILVGDNFGPFRERIYLTDGSEFGDDDLLLDDGDIVDDFDPQVVRKSR